MNDTTTAAEERRPSHRLFALYLLVSAPAYLFPHRPSTWPFLLAAHLGVAAFLSGLGPTTRWRRQIGARYPRFTNFIADWYLLALVPVLYTELATLNLAVWDGRYFDPLIIDWEQAIFGGQPSQEWAARFNDVKLSELLHGAYLSYYVIIYTPPVILYMMGRRSAQRLTVFAVMLTFFLHYIFFIYFPVAGPRYLFEPPSGEVATGAIYAFTHRLLEAGSSQGAAFPSSHVGVATAQTLMTYRYLPKLAPILSILTILLALGAIYGGFHYATDASAGFALAVIALLLAPRLRRLLAR